MKKLLIIKLGGSILTDKNSAVGIARVNELQELFGEIGKLYKQRYSIILVHGAGSFGHPLAKKYNLSHGFKTWQQKFGYSLTAHSVSQLNLIVTQELLNIGLPAISLSPHAFIQQHDKKLETMDVSLVKKYLDFRFIPILFGDVVIDTALSSSIVSGDAIIAQLSKKFRPEKVIFLTDVDGVFDRNPKLDQKAELISEINNNNYQKVVKKIGQFNQTDVTGEMKGKLNEIRKNLARTDVYIINGLKKGLLEKAVASDQVGTVLRFD